MLVIVGYLIIILSVFGGFALAGGHLAALWQPVEVLMIGGGAIGAFVVGNSSKAIKANLPAIRRIRTTRTNRNKALKMPRSPNNRKKAKNNRLRKQIISKQPRLAAIR